MLHAINSSAIGSPDSGSGQVLTSNEGPSSEGPSNERRRQDAKRKLEDQLERTAHRAKRRRVITAVVAAVAVVAVALGVVYLTRDGDASEAAADDAARPPAAGGPCYEPSPDRAAKPVDLPDDPDPTPAEGTVPVSLDTNRGEIGLDLDRAQGPCAVQSFQHLVRAQYFDGTECHRLTTGEGLKVLQCGDPSGSGSGGPGYTMIDEPPQQLEPAPSPYDRGGSVIYPRGTLAMAKSAQPDSGGSQFFMVYEDSYLPPDYTAFGRIDEAGLQVLDDVARAGAEGGASDGAPAQPVRIEQARLRT